MVIMQRQLVFLLDSQQWTSHCFHIGKQHIEIRNDHFYELIETLFISFSFVDVDRKKGTMQTGEERESGHLMNCQGVPEMILSEQFLLNAGHLTVMFVFRIYIY